MKHIGDLGPDYASGFPCSGLSAFLLFLVTAFLVFNKEHLGLSAGVTDTVTVTGTENLLKQKLSVFIESSQSCD